jgi:hypothetical protein
VRRALIIGLMSRYGIALPPLRWWLLSLGTRDSVQIPRLPYGGAVHEFGQAGCTSTRLTPARNLASTRAFGVRSAVWSCADLGGSIRAATAGFSQLLA